MAQELATALKIGKGKGKVDWYPEGTALADLPNAVRKMATERGLLRQRLNERPEDDFETLYLKAVDLGLVDLTASELKAAVAEAEAEAEAEEEEEEDEEDDEEEATE